MINHPHPQATYTCQIPDPAETDICQIAWACPDTPPPTGETNDWCITRQILSIKFKEIVVIGTVVI